MGMISPRHYQFERQSGVTLTELLIVIVIIAIVSTFALMNRGSANAQFQRQNIARELKVALEQARFDSVKRRTGCTANQAKVVVNSTSFVLWTDTDVDGIPEASESVTNAFSGQNIVVADSAGATLTSANTIYFNQRGETVDLNGASIAPTFLVCNGGSCPNPLTNDRVSRIYVSPTGTVNMLGAAAPPTLGSSGGTAAATDVINNNLVLSSGSGCL